ncbi:unnamed protein product [Arctogadus glacialis]
MLSQDESSRRRQRAVATQPRAGESELPLQEGTGVSHLTWCLTSPGVSPHLVSHLTWCLTSPGHGEQSDAVSEPMRDGRNGNRPITRPLMKPSRTT